MIHSLDARPIYRDLRLLMQWKRLRPDHELLLRRTSAIAFQVGRFDQLPRIVGLPTRSGESIPSRGHAVPVFLNLCHLSKSRLLIRGGAFREYPVCAGFRAATDSISHSESSQRVHMPAKVSEAPPVPQVQCYART